MYFIFCESCNIYIVTFPEIKKNTFSKKEFCCVFSESYIFHAINVTAGYAVAPQYTKKKVQLKVELYTMAVQIIARN